MGTVGVWGRCDWLCGWLRAASSPAAFKRWAGKKQEARKPMKMESRRQRPASSTFVHCPAKGAPQPIETIQAQARRRRSIWFDPYLDIGRGQLAGWIVLNQQSIESIEVWRPSATAAGGGYHGSMICTSLGLTHPPNAHHTTFNQYRPACAGPSQPASQPASHGDGPALAVDAGAAPAAARSHAGARRDVEGAAAGVRLCGQRDGAGGTCAVGETGSSDDGFESDRKQNRPTDITPHLPQKNRATAPSSWGPR